MLYRLSSKRMSPFAVELGSCDLTEKDVPTTLASATSNNAERKFPHELDIYR